MMPCSFVSGDSIFNQIFKERTGSPLGTEREVNCLSFKAFTFPAPFKCHLNSGIPKHKNAPAVMFSCVPRQTGHVQREKLDREELFVTKIVWNYQYMLTIQTKMF